jgi:hypothetical protein
MRRTAYLLTAIALLAGCHGDLTASAEDKDLDALRRVTTPLQDFQAAKTAGWSAEITKCMADAAGAMGFHYGKTSIIDGTVRVDEPELLLYEPDVNGTMKLVAVEYIIPYTAHSRSDTPPCSSATSSSRTTRFNSGDSTSGRGRTTHPACTRTGTRASRARTPPTSPS